jgi:hypothetical protein
MEKSSPNKIGTTKLVAIVALCFALGLAAAFLYNSGNSGPDAKATGGGRYEVTRAAAGNKPAMGITVPPMATMGDVQEYMRTVGKTPIPDDYVRPEYIDASLNYDEAMRILNERFPDFSNKEGNELIKAVWDQPLRFQAMILENKAARLRYRPELQYDSTFVRQR